MTHQRFIKELLQTDIGTEGSLLIMRKIHDTLIQSVDKTLIPRSEAAWVIGPAQVPGSSYDFNLADEDTMNVRAIAEGAEIFQDNEEYTSINILPTKYGVQIRITSEMLEDAKWNLLDMNVMTAGKRVAENENSLVITALDTAANTVTGGAAITIANIATAMQNVEDNDYTPTTFIVGNEVLTDLRNIDTFVEADKVGNTEMLQRGFLGTIFGMNVLRVSSNAGATRTTAYVFDRTQAYAIVEKRPITVERFRLETFDMDGAIVTHRVAVAALRTNAISNITTS